MIFKNKKTTELIARVKELELNLKIQTRKGNVLEDKLRKQDDKIDEMDLTIEELQYETEHQQAGQDDRIALIEKSLDDIKKGSQ
jgi:TolA-binding protein